MAKKETEYFWNLKGQTLGGRGFGEPVTDILGEDSKRIENYLGMGKIVTDEPVDFDRAKENELAALRIEVGKLQTKNSELESKVKKTPQGVKAATTKIKKLEKDLAEAVEAVKEIETLKTQIADLTSELAEATKPDTEGGK